MSEHFDFARSAFAAVEVPPLEYQAIERIAAHYQVEPPVVTAELLRQAIRLLQSSEPKERTPLDVFIAGELSAHQELAARFNVAAAQLSSTTQQALSLIQIAKPLIATKALAASLAPEDGNGAVTR